MHFDGVRYKPSSDGAYVPGFSGGAWTGRLVLRGMIGIYQVAKR